jgi:serine/threonine-protein kinase
VTTLRCGAVAITPGSIDAGVRIGEIFVDKYRVDAILGHGGMGVVALCTHLALNEQVAIKMLRKDVLDDADAVERFMREAQAAVKLKSEFVARVSDVGRSRNNVPYMVMEYLEGHDLGELLDERGSLGLTWAVELTLQACEALAEAHSIGIIHRDVKPTNLFVTWRPDGSALIKVLDFGISKALTGNAMQLTQTQSLLGTPAYMSPEQMRSARMVDARTDIWSLGTVLFELLEGHRPFEAESFSEMCVKVAVDPPGAMTNTPLALQQVVLRCLEKAPEQRYASMADLAADLVPFSQDPHQAQVLVERMSRMLRRSQVFEWNPSPGSASATGRTPRSGERAAETAAVDAAVSSSGIPAPLSIPSAGSGPVAQAPRPIRGTGIRSAVSETMAITRPRRRGAIIIASLAAAAAALGAAVSLARAPDRADPHGNASGASPPSGSAAPPSTAPKAIAAPAPGPGDAPKPSAEGRAGGSVEVAAPTDHGSAAGPIAPALAPQADAPSTAPSAAPSTAPSASDTAGTSINDQPAGPTAHPVSGAAGASTDHKPARPTAHPARTGKSGHNAAARPSNAPPISPACAFADQHGNACPPDTGTAPKK